MSASLAPPGKASQKQQQQQGRSSAARSAPQRPRTVSSGPSSSVRTPEHPSEASVAPGRSASPSSSPSSSSSSSTAGTTFSISANAAAAAATASVSCLPKISPPVLLSSRQLQHFIVQGYLVITPEQLGLPVSFHANMYGKLQAVYAREGNAGNNILPRIPEINQVIGSPAVVGALTSILGRNYGLHPHRHGHLSAPGKGTQQFHKDSYWGMLKTRYHVPHWIMAMYYPQTTHAGNGPTSVYVGSQYNELDRAKQRHLGQMPATWPGFEERVHVPAGSLVLIHYDIWHKGTANAGEAGDRYMLKFQFYRTEDPQIHGSPSWDCESRDWLLSPAECKLGTFSDPQLLPMYRNIFYRMLGANSTAAASAFDINDQLPPLPALVRSLRGSDDLSRLKAAYWIAIFHREKAYPDLLDLLRHNEEPGVRLAICSLGAMNPDVIYPIVINTFRELDSNSPPTFLHNLLAVIELLGAHPVHGPVAVETLCRRIPAMNRLQRPNDTEAVSAAAALCKVADVVGMAGQALRNATALMESGAVQLLLKLAGDQRHGQIRAHAMLALVRIAPNLPSPSSSSSEAAADATEAWSDDDSFSHHPHFKSSSSSSASASSSSAGFSNSPSSAFAGGMASLSIVQHNMASQQRVTAAAVVGCLERIAFADEERYARAYALEVLGRMTPSQETVRVLMQALRVGRWCPLTDEDNPF